MQSHIPLFIEGASGGREHALVYLGEQSPVIGDIYCFGPNFGIEQESKVVAVTDPPQTLEEKIDFAKRTRALTVVGPEASLAAGIVDAFRSEGLSIFGPTKEAARLESSKVFAKEVMAASGVATAPFILYDQHDLEGVLKYILSAEFPKVIKVDGLAAGKGAIVCQNFREAFDAVLRCFYSQEFGDAANKILVEDFLHPHPRLKRGEISVIALVDIHGNFVMLLPAQDYKAVNNNDEGPNTGGMGAFAPVPWVTADMLNQIGEEVFRPVIAEMIKRGTPFSGALYAGLMWTKTGPAVVEFNVRFGDPELQPLAMLLDTDIMPILKTIADGESIKGTKLTWKSGSAVTLVLASCGYPKDYHKGLTILGLDSMPTDPSFKVFHAGTRGVPQKIDAYGGRVLCLTKWHPPADDLHAKLVGDEVSNGLEEAASIVRELAHSIGTWFDDDKPPFPFHYRTDVGFNVPIRLVQL